MRKPRTSDGKNELFVILMLAILLVSAVYYFHPWSLTLLSATTINIDQQGGLEGNKLVGTYWSLLMSVDFTDQVGMYTFDDAEAHKTGSSPYWQGKNMTLLNSVKLWIDPGQPYYERPMQLKSSQVTPKAYQNWQIVFTGIGRDKWLGVDALYSGHWETITSDWILHTPFTVKVYVNDTLVGQQTIDTIGTVDTTTIGLGKEVDVSKSASEYLTITNLGALQTGYTFPIWPGVVWFNNQYFYLNSEAVQKAIHNPYPSGDGGTSDRWGVMPSGSYEDSYAWYWYGGQFSYPIEGEVKYDAYWRDEGDPKSINPAHTPVSPILCIPFDQVGGWADGGGGTGILARVKPVRPVIFDKSSLPSDKQQYMSLVEFLEKRVSAQKPLMPSWGPDANNIVFTKTDEQNGFLRVYLPWNSFTRLIDVRISTELANTIVWQPQVSNIKIVDYLSDMGEIGERKTASITLRQDSTVPSSGVVEISPITSGLYWDFEPQTFGTGTMQPGETKPFTFDVVNLGQPTRTDFQFKIEVKNSLGQVTDSKTVVGTLLARTPQGSILLVRTIDAETKVPISGIHVIVNYDTLSKEGWTSGGQVAFDFGGGTPSVSISTAETLTYKSATTTKQLAQGQNAVTLELVRQGVTPNEIPWTWIIIGSLVAVMTVTIAYLYKKRKPATTPLRRTLE